MSRSPIKLRSQPCPLQPLEHHIPRTLPGPADIQAGMYTHAFVPPRSHRQAHRLARAFVARVGGSLNPTARAPSWGSGSIFTCIWKFVLRILSFRFAWWHGKQLPACGARFWSERPRTQTNFSGCSCWAVVDVEESCKHDQLCGQRVVYPTALQTETRSILYKAQGFSRCQAFACGGLKICPLLHPFCCSFKA